jgi:predicted nucleic acid-binding protein
MKLDGLLDTNILIDISRKYTPALDWVKANPTLFLGVSSFVRMELMGGVSNKLEHQKWVRELSSYPLLYPNDKDSQWALENFERYHLTHNIDIMDCVIASINFRLQLPLYTRNAKHFLPFKSIRIIKPYQ